MYEKQAKIYPRAVHGWFARWRWTMVWLTQGVFYGLPWLQWNGRQAMLFDLNERRFFVFGLVLQPQDLIYLAALLIISALALFFFTAVAGRLWCGYSCPQTVYTEIFLWVERHTEGDRVARMRLDAAPWGAQKLARKGAKQAAWLAIGLVTGFTFVGYFTPIRTLTGSLAALALSPWEIFWILFYAFATYGNAGYLREQVCKYMCPYARFQSALIDKDSLVIAYDTGRGESRGSRSRKADPKALGLGDCVDCSLCVQVCPTGIDIRNGLQNECIGCAACIDVCDDVMGRMGYPPGLIRYSTENGVANHWTRNVMLRRVAAPAGADLRRGAARGECRLRRQPVAAQGLHGRHHQGPRLARARRRGRAGRERLHAAHRERHRARAALSRRGIGPAGAAHRVAGRTRRAFDRARHAGAAARAAARGGRGPSRPRQPDLARDLDRARRRGDDEEREVHLLRPAMSRRRSPADHRPTQPSKELEMQLPDFYDEAPRIRMRDPLAEFLGAAQGGILEYGYADVVKLAGHSCPTVASSYLMTRAALAALYPGSIPVRGGIAVDLCNEALEGVTGVIASVVTLLTGATVDTGFKGIGGRFDRRRLLAFGVELPGQIRFTRLDTAASVVVSARLDRVPGDARMPALIPRCLAGIATSDEEALFRTLWQARVRTLLTTHADDPQVIVVHRGTSQRLTQDPTTQAAQMSAQVSGQEPAQESAAKTPRERPAQAVG